MRISIDPWLRGAVLLTGLGLLCKALIAAHIGVLADEAYYWTWSNNLALGYFDQPPMIAWLLHVTVQCLGDDALPLRSLALVSGVVGWYALRRYAGDQGLWAAWWVLAPPLFWLTLFATPDAYLLCFWSCALAGACRGGRGWWATGLFIGLAGLTKYTGCLLLPLLLVAAPADERPTALVRMVLPAAALWTPHIGWLLANDGVSLGYALEEGLRHPQPPGLFGLLEQLAEQMLIWTPLVFVVGLRWLYRARPGRTADRPMGQRVWRVAWWTSAPVLLLFVLASPFGPPEAHWPVPAWVGLGLACSHITSQQKKTLWTGLWLGGFVSSLVFAHAIRPLTSAPWSPYHRHVEGEALAGALNPWVMPIGALPRTLEPSESPVVWTERYQEASLLRYHLGINAWVAPRCGRANQFGLWPAPAPDITPTGVWFLRPTTSGPPTCTDALGQLTERHLIHGRTPEGEVAGKWDLWEVEAE